MATGQAMEFRVWTELIQQSRGLLHIFLPMLDEGLDAVIHRLTDGEYIPVQVKCRTSTFEGMVHLMIPASKLVDDRALLIAGLLRDDTLGPMLLVVDEGTFKKLAARELGPTGDIYAASFSMHPRASHWRPHMVIRDHLAERLLGTPPPSISEAELHEMAVEPRDRHSAWLGFLGELEVIRRLAESPRLDLFRPFPDLEIVEVLARDNVSGRCAGLQVKTAVPAVEGEARIQIRKRTFVPAASTFVVALAWIAATGRFADECLVVPTDKLVGIATEDDDGWVVVFRPDSPLPTRVDPYRRRLADLGEFVGQVTANRSC